MIKKIIFSLFAALLFLSIRSVSANTTSDSLCEFGIYYFQQGKFNEALNEFNKALRVDSNNLKAKEYVNKIFEKERPVSYSQAPVPTAVSRPVSRDDAMDMALNNLNNDEFSGLYNSKPIVVGPFKVSGEAQVRMGATSNNFIWKRANWDLNEKNYRMLSDTAYDNRADTYDPRIYDRMQFKVGTEKKQGLDFYSNITVDPWSFTGKTSKMTVGSQFGDTADVEMKYWSNTGYTINDTVFTNKLGNSFSLPETKVVEGRFNGFDVNGAFRDAITNLPDVFTIPESKIYRDFQPVRELWTDYKNDNVKLRVYPIAYENQTFVIDDPLKLSGNRIWWEDSPWIRKWHPGNFNSGVTPVDFTKGFWDKSISFFARDSEGQRLTSLRGFNFEATPQEGTYLATSFATPKDPWQDYASVDNIISATRAKQFLGDNFSIGGTFTSRLGFNTAQKSSTDAKNFVGAVDLAYEITRGILANLEVSQSQAQYDLTNSQYKTRKDGNAYYASLTGKLFSSENIINTQYGYDGIKPEKGESFFNKFRIFASRMDKNFDQPLSSYVETRDDEWWGRHIHFRKPFKYYYQGEGQKLTFDDIKNYKIGNGIDIGRSVLGFRLESALWDNKVENLFDVRNVHDVNNKFIENVARDEMTVSVTEKLTAKGLGIYQKLPKTKGGIDPYIFDTTTGQYFLNSTIEDGLDASLKTGSLGLEYEFFDWLALNSIYERTNDYSLAYDNFPRSIFNSSNMGSTYYQDGNKYRQINDFLYNQQYFPSMPYKFYDIFKLGMRFNPIKNMEFYVDYTHNDYKEAGQVDDNMNHVGFEVNYAPVEKWAMFFKYTYSRWRDLYNITNGGEVSGHNNFFAELRYRVSKDEDWALQYGEASRDPYNGGVLDIGWDPYGGSLRTLDTQHIFRVYYRKKF